ncbi:MAG: PqqD family peptide modification chaperone [Syntrophales bacterium]|nr:PqqD family peptide modification chaperone [Syntrophales bacterium]
MIYLKANANLVLREEFDDWAVLFDPDTGHTYALNPVAVIVWKHLTGTNSEEDIIRIVAKEVESLPPEAKEQISSFLTALQTLNLVENVEREKP